MVDIDLDIALEKQTEIKLLGETKRIRNLSMEEDFEVKSLRQEIGQLVMNRKDKNKYREVARKLLKLVIEPISDAEISQIKQKQFDALMEEIDYMDMRDQGVVNNKKDYQKLKVDLAKQTMQTRADGSVF